MGLFFSFTTSFRRGFFGIKHIDNKINIKINKMPKVNTLLVNNQFRINTVGSEGEQKYWNAAWVSVHFDSVDVFLTYEKNNVTI